jgi:hypothetical protein
MTELMPEVAAKYRLKKGHQATEIITAAPNRRIVNLAKVTLKQVEKLLAEKVKLPLAPISAPVADTSGKNKKALKGDKDYE